MIFGEGVQPVEVQMTPGGVMWQRHEVDGGSLIVSPDCDDTLILPVLQISTGDLSDLKPVLVPGRERNAYNLGKEHIVKTGQHIYEDSTGGNGLTWGIWALRANVSLGEGFERTGANTEPIYRYEGSYKGPMLRGYTFEGVQMLAAFLPEIVADEAEQRSPVWLMDRANGYADRLVYPTNWQEARDVYAAARAAVGLEEHIRLDHCGYNDIINRSGPITRVTKIDSAACKPIEF